MPELKEILLYLLAFIWIVIGSTQVAKLFQKFKLPLITGFLLSGFLIGPFGLKLLQTEAIQKLDFVNYTALAFIALAAGSELFIKEIKNNIKSILWNTFGQLIIIFTIVSLSVYFLQDFIPFMKKLPEYSKISIAILTGTIFIARSPSSTIAVINEMRAKGRFTRMVISATVLLDVLVILLFTICLSVAHTLVTDADFTYKFILFLLLELLITFAAGFILSKLIEFILKLPVGSRYKAGITLLAGFLVYQFSKGIGHISLSYINHEIHIEALLVCIIASYRITNYSKLRVDLHKIIEDLGPLVYAAFFTLVGASLALDVLLNMWYVELFLFVVYFISLFIGTYLGNTFAANPKIYRRIGWMPFLTQAGVGFALIYEVSGSFPEWGNQLATVIIAVIILNQIIGPPLFKWALKLVGESRTKAKSDIEPNKNALVFGIEHQSIELVKNLQKDQYEVEVATVEERKNVEQLGNTTIHYLQHLTMTCLNEINISKFDVVILMLSDKENFKISELIYENIGTQVVIVRLFDSVFADRFRELGAIVVDPADAIIRLLEQFVRSPITASFILGKEDHKAMVDFKVLDLELHGMALRDLRLPNDVIIVSVKRKGQVLISHGYTRLRIGDIVTMVGSVDSLENLSLQFQE